jgi:hypothetical protein
MTPLSAPPSAAIFFSCLDPDRDRECLARFTAASSTCCRLPDRDAERFFPSLFFLSALRDLLALFLPSSFFLSALRDLLVLLLPSSFFLSALRDLLALFLPSIFFLSALRDLLVLFLLSIFFLSALRDLLAPFFPSLFFLSTLRDLLVPFLPPFPFLSALRDLLIPFLPSLFLSCLDCGGEPPFRPREPDRRDPDRFRVPDDFFVLPPTDPDLFLLLWDREPDLDRDLFFVRCLERAVEPDLFLPRPLRDPDLFFRGLERDLDFVLLRRLERDRADLFAAPRDRERESRRFRGDRDLEDFFLFRDLDREDFLPGRDLERRSDLRLPLDPDLDEAFFFDLESSNPLDRLLETFFPVLDLFMPFERLRDLFLAFESSLPSERLRDVFFPARELFKPFERLRDLFPNLERSKPFDRLRDFFPVFADSTPLERLRDAFFLVLESSKSGLREARFPNLERSKPLGERAGDVFFSAAALSASLDLLRESFLPLSTAFAGGGEADFPASPF